MHRKLLHLTHQHLVSLTKPRMQSILLTPILWPTTSRTIINPNFWHYFFEDLSWSRTICVREINQTLSVSLRLFFFINLVPFFFWLPFSCFVLHLSQQRIHTHNLLRLLARSRWKEQSNFSFLPSFFPRSFVSITPFVSLSNFSWRLILLSRSHPP